MARVHRQTMPEIIRTRISETRYHTVPVFCAETGFKQSTFYDRLNKGGWKIEELQFLDRYLHFTEDDTDVFYGRRQQE